MLLRALHVANLSCARPKSTLALRDLGAVVPDRLLITVASFGFADLHAAVAAARTARAIVPLHDEPPLKAIHYTLCATSVHRLGKSAAAIKYGA